jgi:aminopeptidase N
MDLYFERHDGEATTIEAFIACFEATSGEDLTDFALWYTAAGTPEVTIAEHFDAAAATYRLDISQKTQIGSKDPDARPRVLPIRFGLLGPNGGDASYTGVSGADVRGDVLVLRANTTSVTFTGVTAKPVASLFRGFSAPVTLVSPHSAEDQLFLARHDSDPFNRWQAIQDVSGRLLTRASRGEPTAPAAIDALAAALEETLAAKDLDAAYKAFAVSVPSETTIARALGTDVDPDAVHQARRTLIGALAHRLQPVLNTLYLTHDSRLAYSPDFEQAGRRSLKNMALNLLVLGGTEGAETLAKEQYERALNMTDRLSALTSLVMGGSSHADGLMAHYRARFCADPLVLDKWLGLMATAPVPETIGRLEAILVEPDFPRNNPNRLRAIASTFGASNPTQFARADGAGFEFLTRFVRDVDGRNPQVAARVLTSFRTFPSLEAKRRATARAALVALKAGGPLSINVSEILDRMLDA